MKDRKKLFIFALAGAIGIFPIAMIISFLTGFIKQRPIIMDKPAPPLTYSEAFSTTCEVFTKIEVVLPTIILGTILGLIIGLAHILDKRKKELHNE